MGTTRRGKWYEREEVQKVTLDYVKENCKNITKREKEILQIVYDRKLVSRNHLEILSPSLRRLTGNRTRLTNRTIKKLFQKMCLDKAHPEQRMGEGNLPCVVALDKGGSIILDVPHKKRISHNVYKVKDKYYIKRKLPSNFRHINGVNQLEVDTILFCKENDFEMIKWEQREQFNTKTFYYGEEKTILIPDVLMILNLNNKIFPAFIEFDTGSESLRYKEPPIIRDKIIKYRKYKNSQLWENEDWQEILKYRQFPILLFITEDHKRIDFFNKKSKEFGIKGLGIYHENYKISLEKMATLVK